MRLRNQRVTEPQAVQSDEPDAEGAGLHPDLEEIGQRIRKRRQGQGLSLANLAQQTGLSVSMLSSVERGRANPSAGTLIAIADALGTSMMALCGGGERQHESIVSRRAEQPVMTSGLGIRRRVLLHDAVRGFEMAENEYDPGAVSTVTPTKHRGIEFGVLVAGRLEVMVNGTIYVLETGDAIAYPSTSPHRSRNLDPWISRTIWVNLFHET